ncbi:MAG: SAM-dependent methyltransferase [Desulfobulbaceae bacterium]|nr:SAM-dependent methyltransferase [Desulfobulbaceae bacterium]
MKLGKRLKQIELMVTSDYTHIWDCCCDHGLLGSALLSRFAAPCIHFVDTVPELIDELEKKLQRSYPRPPSNWQVHCLDVAELPVEQYQGKNLVIIAGVGGDLVTQLVNAIHKNQSATNIDFLLCPVHHQFTLRQQLIQLNFSLINEVLVEENQRFYEILLVSTPTMIKEKQLKINPVGELIWQANSAEQSKITVNYLNKTLNHFQRMQQGNNPEVQHIIDAYRSVNTQPRQTCTTPA